MPAANRTFELVGHIPLPRAAVWHILSNTDRLNRHIGLSAVQFNGLGEDRSGVFRAATTRLAGLVLGWREYPFQWEKDHRYSVLRVYDKGPMARFEGGIALEDADNFSTKITVFSHMTPRGVLGQLLVPLIARRFQRNTLRFCQQYLRADALKNPTPVIPTAVSIDENLLRRLTNDLKNCPVDENYVDSLAEFLKTADDNDVATIRPYVWAKERDLDENESLRTCLHGVKSGLLDMRWSMMCPNCRVSKGEAATLSELDSKVHCDLCGVDYDLNFDRYIELKFQIHPALRAVNSNLFCIGGPYQTPHILIQRRIDPHETVDFPIPERDDELRLRVLRINQTVEVDRAAPPGETLIFDGAKWNARRVSSPCLIKNASDTAIFVALEKVEWDPLAATAARVTTLQEFRTLFSNDVLRSGRELAIENVTLFFSDLSNSTSLYESIGDGPAYGRVGSHFDFLIHHIGECNGAVVKTMGDAVMAVFHSPADAARAALDIQDGFRTFRRTLSVDGDMDLKIGLHHGPALVVNSNDKMDYFGRTVNIAARVVAASRGGDIVLTGDVWEYSGVQRLLIERQADLSRFEINLRGVEQSFAMVRVRPQKN